jgi:ubiquinone/menaquinone biosynthesis C-methylase UbiE
VNRTSGIEQSEMSVASNAAYFFQHLREYHDSVATIDTYRTLHDFISKKVEGAKELLDVGNGGVFAYDTSRVESITAIDLFLGDLPANIIEAYFPKNARARQGSALALPENDDSFDMVLMVMLLHHLTGHDWQSSWRNTCQALREGWRVLKPGGRLLVVESCVPGWFFQLEKPALWVMSRLVKSIFSHPITLQFPAFMIADELRKRFDLVQVSAIPKGRFVLQFGIKTPSSLTPVVPFAFEASKKRLEPPTEM